jgi:pimeloyl-ACP methyl ester carboxylesterase
MGGWIWEEVASSLRDRDHNVHELTLSGLHPDVDSADAAGVRLITHVQDVLNYLASNNLEQVVLVGHSYSGIVVGQVAAQVHELVTHTVFIEAFLPIDGKSLLEVSGLDVGHERSLIEANSGLWPAPTLDELKQQSSLNKEQVKFLASRLVGHPGRTITDPAVLTRPLSLLRATFIAGEGWLSESRESELADALRRETSWSFRAIEGGHWLMLTNPDQLSDLLHEVVS